MHIHILIFVSVFLYSNERKREREREREIERERESGRIGLFRSVIIRIVCSGRIQKSYRYERDIPNSLVG